MKQIFTAFVYFKFLKFGFWSNNSWVLQLLSCVVHSFSMNGKFQTLISMQLFVKQYLLNCKYSLAIAMCNVFRHKCSSNVWLNGQFNQIFHERENQIIFTSNVSSRVGCNPLRNCFTSVRLMLCFDWILTSEAAMKAKCKRMFLT